MDIWKNEPDITALRNARTALNTGSRQAIDALKLLAERGSVMSRIYLGEAFLSGTAGTINLEESEKWYRGATESGLSYAHYCLGRVYLCMKDYVRAEGAFATAAQKNYPPALRMLGFMCMKGDTASRDWGRAKEFLERAVSAGDVYAKAYLAGLLVHGPSWFIFRSPFRPLEILKGIVVWLSAWPDVFLDKSSERLE